MSKQEQTLSKWSAITQQNLYSIYRGKVNTEQTKANASTKSTVNFINKKKMEINIYFSRNVLFVFIKHFHLMHAMLASYQKYINNTVKSFSFHF